jgi:hypothetical protein
LPVDRNAVPGSHIDQPEIGAVEFGSPEVSIEGDRTQRANAA